MIVVTVQMVLDCSSNQASDAVNEILREQQRTFSPHSCLMDYAVCGSVVQISDDDADTSNYVEGEAFRTI